MRAFIKPYMAISVCFSLIVPTAHAEFSELIVLGDSLEDTGNFALIDGEFSAPYRATALSNGPLFIEHTADALNMPLSPSRHVIGEVGGTNFSVIGATALITEEFSNMPSQVQALLDSKNYELPSDALYFIAFGANDVVPEVIQFGLSNKGLSDIRTLFNHINLTAQAIASQTAVLIQHGARNIVVSQVPDFGVTPLVKGTSSDPVENALAAAIASFAAFWFNLSMEVHLSIYKTQLAVMTFFGDPGKLVVFDAFNASQQIENLNLPYADFGCLAPDQVTFHPACDNGTNLEGFAFVDARHPSAVVSELFGDALLDLINRHFPN